MEHASFGAPARLVALLDEYRRAQCAVDGEPEAPREPHLVPELRAKGFRVFPLPAGRKKAPPSEWNTNGVDYLIPDGCNVGIDAGYYADGRALLIVDLDCTRGKDGPARWTELVAKHGGVPDTFTVETPTGGRHLYFVTDTPVRNGVEILGAKSGIDIRSKGGYVVGPGSKTADGEYRLSPGSERFPAAAPRWLVELCGQARQRDPKAREPVPGINEARARERATEYLQYEAPLAIEGAAGDTTTFAVAARVRDFGVEFETCLDLLWDHWNERCSPPWPPEELHAKVRNAYNYAGGRQGADAPEAIFAAVPVPAVAETVPAVPRDETAGPCLRLVSIRGIENATLAEPRFIVERIIPAGEVTLLGGHGGSGKSILALSIAAHVAAGADAWAGLSIERGPALFVSLEDRGDFVRWRLRKVVGACGLSAADVERDLRVIDGTAAGALMAETFRDGSARLAETPSMRELRALVQDAGLIVIDNASDAFDGNENARRQVRAFVQTLKGLGRANDAAVLLLAHIDKNAARYGAGGNSYSGSSAWHNSARSRLAIIEGEGKPPTLHHEKANMGPKIAPVRMEWTQNGVLVPAAAVPGRAAKDDADAVLHAVATAAEKGVTVPATMGALHFPQKTLESFGLPPWLAGKQGRHAFEGAMRALIADNRLTVEPYQNASRQTKQRLIAAEPAGFQAPDFDAA